MFTRRTITLLIAGAAIAVTSPAAAQGKIVVYTGLLRLVENDDL